MKISEQIQIFFYSVSQYDLNSVVMPHLNTAFLLKSLIF